jgi:hypothetical protein
MRLRSGVSQEPNNQFSVPVIRFRGDDVSGSEGGQLTPDP